MKKIFYVLIAAISIVIASLNLSFGQSDKEIIKLAEADLKAKNYDAAFQEIVTCAEPDKKKPQEILKESYPYVMGGNFDKVKAIKLNDKDSTNVKCQKLEQIIGYLNANNVADSLFKKTAEAKMYKSLSKKKKNESSLKTYYAKYKVIKDNSKKEGPDNMASDTLGPDASNQVVQPVSNQDMASGNNQQTNTTGNNSNVGNTGNMQIDNSGNSTTVTTPNPQMTNGSNSEMENNNNSQTNNTNQSNGNNSQGTNNSGNNTNTSTNANTTTNANTNTVNTGNSGEKKFYIIAGSYPTESAAQVAVNNLKALGYASQIVGLNPYGNLRICYSSFTNKDEALNELDHIKSEVQADAWLLEK